MAQRAIPLRVLVPTPLPIPSSRTPRPATGSKKKKGGSVGALFRNVLGDQQLAVALVKSPLQYIIADPKTRKIFLFLLLSTAFMVVEFVYGFHSNSLGLVSDACHMLFDCAALAIGLYASYTAKFQANAKFNYGYGRFEVISGYMNAIFLILVASLIVLESLERILDPPQIATDSLLVVSIGGFVVNVVGLVFFHDHHHHGHSHGHCPGHSHSKKEDTSKAKGGDYKVLDVEDHHHHHDHSHNHNHDHAHERHHDHGHGHHHDHSDYSHGHHHEHEHGHDHSNHSHGHHHEHEHGHNHSNHSHGHHHDHEHKHGHDHSHGHHHDHSDHSHGEVEHDHTDHNMQGMFLHILADTLGSIGVVISTLLIQYKGWYLADPACSIFISGLIIASVIPLVRGPAEILLQRMPRGTEKRIQHSMKQVEALDGVWSCQALHVWNFTSVDIVGSLHVQATRGADRDRLRVAVADIMKNAGISDLTLQVETV